jgi:tRNA(Ile)-lysidine synthase
MLDFIRRHRQMRPGDRVGVAVSGGADSVALLRLLLEARSELGVVLSVVHFNHRIRGPAADADEAFVAELAHTHQIEFHCDSGDTPAHARQARLSLEAAGRALRYGFFRRLLEAGMVNRVATAHTLDDQAETVLLRFFRGAGTRGLAGIYPVLVVAPGEAPASDTTCC